MFYFLLAAFITGLFLMIYYSVPPRPQSAERDIAWHKVKMDGSRRVRQYTDSTTAAWKAVHLLDSLEAGMEKYKEVIGYSAGEYANLRDQADLPLGNLLADAMRERGSKEFGVRMDIALANYGGIRIPMAAGPITLGDMFAMFPFDNKLVYVTITGEELMRLMEQLAKTPAFQPMSGVKVRVKDHELKEVTVGGRPVNPSRLYNMVTVDFLLLGGDKLYIGAMATDIVSSENLTIRDVMLDYVKSRQASYRNVTAYSDGRIIMENKDED